MVDGGGGWGGPGQAEQEPPVSGGGCWVLSLGNSRGLLHTEVKVFFVFFPFTSNVTFECESTARTFANFCRSGVFSGKRRRGVG